MPKQLHPKLKARAQATKEVAAELRKEGKTFSMKDKSHQARISARAKQILGE